MIGVKICMVLVYIAIYQVNTQMWNIDGYGTEWVIFIDDEGNRHNINLTMPVLESRTYVQEKDEEREPTFWLYTRNTINNPEKLLVPIQNNTNYTPQEPLVVLVHGWLSNRDGLSTQSIKNAILTAPNRNDNVIIMDWYDMQSLDYFISAKETKNVAITLGELIQSLADKYKINGSKVHFIGHSLGAHVVGLAGIILTHKNLRASRVTGLDPASPFFQLPPIFTGISQRSAAFVDIIHTCIGILGVWDPIGHIDFYPGGGVHQPALCPGDLVPGACEHASAYVYYEKSFRKKFKALKCHNYFIYLLGLCNTNEIALMGDPTSKYARGSFYLDIKKV